MNRTNGLLLLFLPVVVVVTMGAERGLSPATRTSYQLVGFSSTTVAGDAGIRGTLDACQQDFAWSRMCTSEEVLESELPVLIGSTEAAWVRPVVYVGGTSAVDISGYDDDAPRNLSCIGWNNGSSTYRGLTVSAQGAFQARPCDVTRPVACCRYMSVPPGG